jgi:hypothetical protein
MPLHKLIVMLFVSSNKPWRRRQLKPSLLTISVFSISVKCLHVHTRKPASAIKSDAIFCDFWPVYSAAAESVNSDSNDLFREDQKLLFPVLRSFRLLGIGPIIELCVFLSVDE